MHNAEIFDTDTQVSFYSTHETKKIIRLYQLG